MSETRRVLVELLSEVLQVQIAPESESVLRADHTEWDSVNHFRLIMEVEERFGVALDDERAAGLESLSDIESLLLEHGIEKT